MMSNTTNFNSIKQRVDIFEDNTYERLTKKHYQY